MTAEKAKFTTELNVEGAEQTKAAMKGVAEQTGAMTAESAKLGAGLKEQEQSVKATSASVEDYKSLLTQIHPSLGLVVEVMDKGSKIAGELATKQISLGKAFAGATDIIKTHGKTLALLGAGGAAIGAILFLVSQVQKVKEEWAEANDELQRYLKATADAKQSLSEQREAVRDLLETELKRAATAEELNLIQSKIRGATRDGIVSEAAAMQAVVTLVKERHDLESLTIKLVQDTARAIELGEAQPSGRLSVRGLRRGAESVEGIRAERAATEERAGVQAGPGLGEGVSVGAELVEALRTAFESSGAQAPSLEEISAILKAQDIQGKASELVPFFGARSGSTIGASLDEQRLERAKKEFGAPEDLTLARMLEVLQEIARLAQEQSKQSGGTTAQSAGEATGGVTIIQNNGKYIGVDVDAMQANVETGENHRARIGVG